MASFFLNNLITKQPFDFPVFINKEVAGMSKDGRSGLISGVDSYSSAASLYDRYAPTLLGLCKRYCGNIADAEDVLHDGFIKILQNLGRFTARGNGSLEGWMKRIVVNTALNHIRSKVREKNLFDHSTLHEVCNTDMSEEDDLFLKEMTGKITREELMSIICALPPGYRTVFNLYVFECYTHKEIAEALGCSENTSKSQLSKARSLLRKQLNQVLNKTTVDQ